MEADPIDQKTDKARNLITTTFKRTPGPPPQHLYNLSSKIYDNDLSIVFEMIKYKQKAVKEKTRLVFDLAGNKLTSKQCNLFVKINWKNLIALHLDNNQIRDQGCKQIAKGQWPNLARLYIYKNGISEKGCRYLTKGRWPQLYYVDISKNPIGTKGASIVQKMGITKTYHIESEFNRK